MSVLLSEKLKVQKTNVRSCLSDLPLSAEDLNSLKRQGFVSGERRRKGAVYYKLRFRRAGKQIVLGIGTDMAAAESVRKEVQELQREQDAHRDVNVIVSEAKQLLRHTKRRLQPLLEEAGYSFHGFNIRKSRE